MCLSEVSTGNKSFANKYFKYQKPPQKLYMLESVSDAKAISCKKLLEVGVVDIDNQLTLAREVGDP